MTAEQVDAAAEAKLLSMLSVVDPRAIVTLDKARGILYIGGERADDGRLSNLKAEAEFFRQSDLWKLMHETPKELAQRAMFVSSESLDDLKKGKAMLYTLATQQNVLDTFLSYTPKQ